MTPPPAHSPTVSRPNPLQLIDSLRELARLHLLLGMMRDYRPPVSSGSTSASSATPPAPVYLPAVDARRRIEGFTRDYVGVLVRETGWRPASAAPVPELLVEMALHIERYVTHANPRVAWAFAEDLDVLIERVAPIERITRDAKVPINRPCETPGCDGVYELRLHESLVHADDAARERALRRAWPRATCSANRRHRSDNLDLRNPPEEVTTKQLAHWFGLEMQSVRKRMRAAGVTPIREEKPGGHVWNRDVALVVMTRPRVAR